MIWRNGVNFVVVGLQFINAIYFIPQIGRDVSGVQVPPVALGDSAFPLSSWLMNPYTKQCQHQNSTTLINYRLSRARMVTEGTFGELKDRWRILLRICESNKSVEFDSNSIKHVRFLLANSTLI